ncbi:MAG: Rpp14/Pop5 family protein [Candidatus Bathyarchaeota archaeon]
MKIFKRRYIAFRFLNFPFPSRKEFLATLRQNIALSLNGENLEQYHVRIIAYNFGTGFCIVRCNHRTLSKIRYSLESFNEHRIETIKTSGTLKALTQKLTSKTVNRPR